MNIGVCGGLRICQLTGEGEGGRGKAKDHYKLIFPS